MSKSLATKTPNGMDFDADNRIHTTVTANSSKLHPVLGSCVYLGMAKICMNQIRST